MSAGTVSTADNRDVPFWPAGMHTTPRKAVPDDDSYCTPHRLSQTAGNTVHSLCNGNLDVRTASLVTNHGILTAVVLCFRTIRCKDKFLDNQSSRNKETLLYWVLVF